MVEGNSLLDNIRVCYVCNTSTTLQWRRYGDEKQYYICTNCHHQIYYKDHCKQKILYSKFYQQNNKEKQYQYVKTWRNKNKDKIHIQLSEKLKGNHNSWRKKQRMWLLELLGNKCIRCGFMDSRALQLDHINDDGYADKKLMKHHHSILAYYYHNPEEAKQKLQIMCANCNWIKRYEVNKHNQHNR